MTNQLAFTAYRQPRVPLIWCPQLVASQSIVLYHIISYQKKISCQHSLGSTFSIIPNAQVLFCFFSSIIYRLFPSIQMHSLIHCICCNASKFLIVTRPVINRAIPTLHDHMDTFLWLWVFVFVCELRERDRGREKRNTSKTKIFRRPLAWHHQI